MVFFMMKNRSLISTGFFVKLGDNVHFPRVFTPRWEDSKQYSKVSTCLCRARSASFAIIFRLILNFWRRLLRLALDAAFSSHFRALEVLTA